MKTLVLTASTILATALAGRSELIWNEDFTNTTSWAVVSDPDGGSSIASDGVRAALYVNGTNSLAAFAPIGGLKPFVPFDQGNKTAYTMGLTVQDLTWSTSYDISLDQFDASHNYLDTLWQVFPFGSTTTFAGNTNINLGAYSFNANCAYLMPKIMVHTGDGGQTVRFDNLSFDVQAIPEAGSAALWIAGALVCLLHPMARKLTWK
ncbi:MAG TPA: hypothetical protein DCZ95_03965 [Verrucomicrobia bacterium]|nr:hypothetical protein [Verrucomicrobiota bacterium]